MPPGACPDVTQTFDTISAPIGLLWSQLCVSGKLKWNACVPGWSGAKDSWQASVSKCTQTQLCAHTKCHAHGLWKYHQCWLATVVALLLYWPIMHEHTAGHCDKQHGDLVSISHQKLHNNYDFQPKLTNHCVLFKSPDYNITDHAIASLIRGNAGCSYGCQ